MKPAMGSPKESRLYRSIDQRYLKSNDALHSKLRPVLRGWWWAGCIPSDYHKRLLVNQDNHDHRPISSEYACHHGQQAPVTWKRFLGPGSLSLPRVIGGCIWEFKDQGLLKTDGQRCGIIMPIMVVIMVKNISTILPSKEWWMLMETQRSNVGMQKNLQPTNLNWRMRQRGGEDQSQPGEKCKRIQRHHPCKEDTPPFKLPNFPEIGIGPGKDSIISIASYLPKWKADAEYCCGYLVQFAQRCVMGQIGFWNCHQPVFWSGPSGTTYYGAYGIAFLLKKMPVSVTINGTVFTAVSPKAIKAVCHLINTRVQKWYSKHCCPILSKPTDNDKRGWKPHRKLKAMVRGGLKAGRYSNGVNTMARNGSGIFIEYIYTDTWQCNSDCRLRSGRRRTDPCKLPAACKDGLPNIPKVGMQTAVHRAFGQVELVCGKGFWNWRINVAMADEGQYKMPLKDFMEKLRGAAGELTTAPIYQVAGQNDSKTKDGLLIVADSLQYECHNPPKKIFKMPGILINWRMQAL